MSGLILTNNARSSLAAAVATGDGTIMLAAGDGAKFPVFNTAGQWHPVTVLHSDGSFEIMKVTGRTNDVLTVTRAQEGTAAQAFGIGDSVELRITGATMKDLIDGVATLQNAGYITAAQVPVQSVAGKTGAVTLGMGDVGITGKVSQFTNDSGYITGLSWAGLTDKPTTVSAFGITDFVSGNNSNPVDANNTTINGNYYVNTNINLFGQNDGALFVQAYSSGWASQIYQDYRTGQLGIRGKNNGTWSVWRTVWDSGNFNPASKLDATAKAADSTKWNGANKTVSTAAPSGGVDGDIWFQYS